MLVDPTKKEEDLADGEVTVVTCDDQICMVKKPGEIKQTIRQFNPSFMTHSNISTVTQEYVPIDIRVFNIGVFICPCHKLATGICCCPCPTVCDSPLRTGILMLAYVSSEYIHSFAVVGQRSVYN